MSFPRRAHPSSERIVMHVGQLEGTNHYIKLKSKEVEDFYVGITNGPSHEGSVSPIFEKEPRRPHTTLCSIAESVCSDNSASVDVNSKIDQDDSCAIVFQEAPTSKKKKGKPCRNCNSMQHNHARCYLPKSIFCHLCGRK